jgi:hypothetical protein
MIRHHAVRDDFELLLLGQLQKLISDKSRVAMVFEDSPPMSYANRYEVLKRAAVIELRKARWCIGHVIDDAIDVPVARVPAGSKDPPLHEPTARSSYVEAPL